MAQRGILALVGGGEFQAECIFDAELLEYASKMPASKTSGGASNPEVLIMPTAAAYENPSKKIQQGKSYFENQGVKTEVLEIYTRGDALDIEPAALAKALEAASIIYLTDGSPMHLRSVLMNTAVLDEIRSAWQNGTVLVGAGAGGDVFCDYMVDARGGAFTVGLKLITEISIIPKYDLWSKEKINRTVSLAPQNLFVAGVPHQTALLSEAGKPWRQSGVGKIDIFRGGKASGIQDLPQL